MALPSQREAILDLLYHSFFADEPMTTALGLYDGKNRVEVSEEH